MPHGGLEPNAVVVVATIRALKMHGGLSKTELAHEDLDALEAGIPNLLRHVSNIKNVYRLPCVVAVNRFPTDTDAEIAFLIEKCKALGVNVVLSTVWADGGAGGKRWRARWFACVKKSRVIFHFVIRWIAL